MATCSECARLCLDEEHTTYKNGYYQFWCDKWHDWYLANHEACDLGFSHDDNRSDSIAEKYYKISEESKKRDDNSGCFITTIVCNILGNPDNNITLNKLRDFRDNILQKNKKYLGLLITYDIVGPIISNNLIKDENKYQVATNLYNLGIKKVVEFIDNNNYDKAIDLYKDMTQLLIDGYNIKMPHINEECTRDVSIDQLGHGKKYVKKSI